MPLPQRPPDFASLVKIITGAGFSRLMTLEEISSRSSEYHHWDEVRRRPPPNGASHKEWWAAIKFHRQSNYRNVSFKDKEGKPFVYCFTDRIVEACHRIDMYFGGTIQQERPLINPEWRDRYYTRSLVEEAITSSQIEGATTTREVAKEMIRTGRKPRDTSEQMILNNFFTMKEISRLKNEPLTKARLLEIHRLLMTGTLEDPTKIGRFRTAKENIDVADAYGESVHVPPPAKELEARVHAMCRFANEIESKPYIHPVVKAIILHFWLAFDHPFVDGNGRTARALFYWSMIRSGYWLFEFISISQFIRKALSKYYTAFLYTETDSNDLTYFIHYHIDIMDKALKELHAYVDRKSQETREASTKLEQLGNLNHRQQALITHALKHPTNSYTIAGHQLSHGTVYQTARTDLLDLHERGLLTMKKVGRTMEFRPPKDLLARVQGNQPKPKPKN